MIASVFIRIKKMSYSHRSNLTPYTCFSCLSTYKRPFDQQIYVRKCPKCSNHAVQMDIRFKPPKKSDIQQWKKVKFLVEHGFYFQKIYRKENDLWCRERYPQTLEQAKEFVIEFKDQALLREIST